MKITKLELQLIKYRKQKEKYRHSKDYVSKSAFNQLNKEKKEIGKVGLGYKTESYFTEEEMITGYKAPKYSELSEIEKELWQEKENQNQEL